MFEEKNFSVFGIDGLDERMTAIREQIQPIFHELTTTISQELETTSQRSFYTHIAQHRRRSVHPPENTWSAIAENKRGYKMLPHFQLGIWPDYVFMWLSVIDQPPKKKEFAKQHCFI